MSLLEKNTPLPNNNVNTLPAYLLGTPKSPTRRSTTPHNPAEYNLNKVNNVLSSPSRFNRTPIYNKENALPTESLYDSVLVTDKSLLHKTPDRSGRISTMGTPVTPGGRSRSKSPARRLGTLAGENAYEDPLSDTWVTVFGFPPNSSQYVLQHFSQFGKIIKYESPSSGNWIHLQYEAKIQARKALSRNGSSLNKDVLLGVVPCTDQRVKTSSDTLNGSIVHTPSRSSKKHEDSCEGFIEENEGFCDTAYASNCQLSCGNCPQDDACQDNLSDAECQNLMDTMDGFCASDYGLSSCPLSCARCNE